MPRSSKLCAMVYLYDKSVHSHMFPVFDSPRATISVTYWRQKYGLDLIIQRTHKLMLSPIRDATRAEVCCPTLPPHMSGTIPMPQAVPLHRPCKPVTLITRLVRAIGRWHMLS
jgi:hypothetical protein